MIEDIEKIAIASSIWRPKSVTEEPGIILTNWAVFSVNFPGGKPTIHFAGYTGSEGRVCSPLQTYDPETRCGITRSGRIYKLALGREGLNMDSMYVWSHWVVINGSPTYTDVTEVYI